MAFGVGQLEQRVEVGVEVDEAGRDDEAGGVDNASSTGRRDRLAGDEGNPVAGDGDVRPIAGGAGAVDDRPAGDHEVVNN